MLTDSDRKRVKDAFGADDAQVERDHLISHALAALTEDLGERVKFYGGTALARTYLPRGRLSEDIDLISVGSRAEVAAALARTLTRRLAREFGRPIFQPALTDTRGAQAATASFPSGPRIQIQLLPADHYPAWPFERRRLEQRYADSPPAALLTPTLDAFVAWKTVTYMDRRASRDLWDLASLASLGTFTSAAAELFTKFGPFRTMPSKSTLPAAPSEAVWERELAHQTRLSVTAAQARDMVVGAWGTLDREAGDVLHRCRRRG